MVRKEVSSLEGTKFMKKKMNECGTKTPYVIEMIRARKAKFDEAFKKLKN